MSIFKTVEVNKKKKKKRDRWPKGDHLNWVLFFPISPWAEAEDAKKLCSVFSPALSHAHLFEMARGRCYDHNFRRFLPIFGKKLAFFSKTNVMIDFFQNSALLQTLDQECNVLTL
jgi:hypothetical protein